MPDRKIRVNLQSNATNKSVCAVLTRVKDEDVIHDSFLSVAFTTTKHDQVLAELGGRVAVARRWRGPIDLLLPGCGCSLYHFPLRGVVHLPLKDIVKFILVETLTYG